MLLSANDTFMETFNKIDAQHKQGQELLKKLEVAIDLQKIERKIDNVIDRLNRIETVLNEMERRYQLKRVQKAKASEWNEGGW